MQGPSIIPFLADLFGRVFGAPIIKRRTGAFFIRQYIFSSDFYIDIDYAHEGDPYRKAVNDAFDVIALAWGDDEDLMQVFFKAMQHSDTTAIEVIQRRFDDMFPPGCGMGPFRLVPDYIGFLEPRCRLRLVRVLPVVP